MSIKKFSIKNYDMKKYYGFLEKTVLFQGCDDESIENMLDCLSAEIRTYDKDEVVFHTGDVNVPLGVVLSGKVHIGQSDVFGNYNIMSDAKPGEFFAESFACARNIPMIPEVVADEKSEILFLGIEKVLSTCRGACQFHTKLVSNLVTAIALIPFAGFLVKLSIVIVKPDARDAEDKANLMVPDVKLFEVPAMALSECNHAIARMGEVALKNIRRSYQLLQNYDVKRVDVINENEDQLDQFTDAMDGYLVNLSKYVETDNDNQSINILMQANTNFERIGDHAANIAEWVAFSITGRHE